MPADPIADVRALIARHWGFREMRPLQEQAICACIDRRDSLVVMPTGGGKSLCYQAPAALRTNETTVVVSPLISLMKDQVDHLTSVDVAALRVDSTLGEAEKLHAAREIKAGRVRLLFVSPERLMMDRFQAFLHEVGVRTFAIDEAHCISHWGHDFRPEYRQIATLRDRFPEASFHAFTATATEPVRADIAAQLKLRNPAILVGNFDRPNLTYRVIPRAKMLDQVLEVIGRHQNEAGIIYCISRNKVDALTKHLQELGYNAMRYRAAHPDESQEANARERKATHDAFRAGKCDLVVATVAFGMGIDRSNIRYVLHTGMPKSIEHYQQEAGRAGRDGLEAECTLLHSGMDTKMWKEIAQKSANEGRLAQDQLEHSLRQTEEIHAYARSAGCRHKGLVEHFGQAFESTNCGACDLCLGEIAFEPDSTTIAKKILSCVARVQERYGAGHVVDVLRGQSTDRMTKLQHDQLTTFGLLREHREAHVREWVYQLIYEGVLEQTEAEYPVLKLNDGSWQVMRGQREVKLTKPGASTGTRRGRVEEASWEGVNSHVFDELRNWRRDVAADKGLPPYTIFHDSALREMSRVRPSTLEGLRYISGVGDAKLRDHGSEILRIIDDLCREHRLTRDNAALVPAAPQRARPVNEATREAFPYFRKGKSLIFVADALGKAPSTVREYLCGYIECERPDSVDAWVDPDVQVQITEAAKLHGTQKLKPVFLALNEQVPYDLIRIVLTYLNTRTEADGSASI